MKNLQLPLKRNWFDLTKSGLKTEDYREITPYWCSRLLTVTGGKRNQKYWSDRLSYPPKNPIENILFCEVEYFYANIMTLGYPKSNDSSHILKLEHKGIEIRTGNPEWGAEEGKLYFVIKHGKIL